MILYILMAFSIMLLIKILLNKNTDFVIILATAIFWTFWVLSSAYVSVVFWITLLTLLTLFLIFRKDKIQFLIAYIMSLNIWKTTLKNKSGFLELEFKIKNEEKITYNDIIELFGWKVEFYLKMVMLWLVLFNLIFFSYILFVILESGVKNHFFVYYGYE